MFADTFKALALSFGAAGPYVPALLTWPGEPVLDAGGSIGTPGTPDSMDCFVQVDVATEAMRADADFQSRDVRLLILSSGLQRVPDESARVVIGTGANAGVYTLQTVSRDPVGVGFECRARFIKGAVS